MKNNIKNKPKTGHHRKKNIRKGSFIVKDEYAINAQKAGYRARSIYKLLELQEKFELIKENYTVCDIGCTPGSFIQAIRNIVKTSPIIGIDIQETKKFSYPNVYLIKHDIFEFESLKPKISEIIGDSKFDVITSDIAPNTTGIKDIDQYASVELNIEICKFSDIFLKKGGNMILKIFKGEDFREILSECKKRFNKISEYKPLACRDCSFETYLVCLEKK